MGSNVGRPPKLEQKRVYRQYVTNTVDASRNQESQCGIECGTTPKLEQKRVYRQYVTNTVDASLKPDQTPDKCYLIRRLQTAAQN